MLKHVLVPLDGSVLAEAALPIATFLAEKLRARVTLIHVMERNAPLEVHGQPHLREPDLAAAYLEDIAQRCFPGDLQVDFHVHTAAVDNEAESIAAHRKEFSHDLIVMCSHGRGRALHLMLGSMAQRIIAMGSVPVLIVHPPAAGKDKPVFSCVDIMVPLDSDPEHAEALPVAMELARACAAHLHLVSIVPSFTTLSGQMSVTSRLLPGTTAHMLEMSSQSAELYLQGIQGALSGQGVQADAQVLRGDPARVITDAALQSKMDLIILATHGKAGLQAFWAGSVAHMVCSQSRTPLLLVPIRKT